MSYTSREQGLKDYERTRAYESHPGLPDEYFKDTYDQELPPDPFGTDLFDRVQAPLNKGQIFLGGLLTAPNQQGGTFKDDMLIAHARPDGKPHDWQDPSHGGIPIGNLGVINPHGQRGSGTWPDGTSRNSPLYNQGGRTFADGTPVTMENYELFLKDPSTPNNLLQRVGNKLKEIWNRPIIAPTITKDEHDQLIQGGGGGVHNWQNH